MKKVASSKRKKTGPLLAFAGTLTTVFGAAVIGFSPNANADTPPRMVPELDCEPFSNVSATSPAEPGYIEPATINALGSTAEAIPLINNPNTIFPNLLQRQDEHMRDTATAKLFNDYLAKFEQFRNMPLCDMAEHVNPIVIQDIKYNEATYGDQTISYLASPAETVKNHAGDCKDFATLQYFILRHLGVPPDRLFLMGVNDENKTGSSNHLILVLDIAQTGDPQQLAVLNDGGFIVHLDDYTKGKMCFDTDIKYPVAGCWNDSYAFYSAENENADWEIKSSADSYNNKRHFFIADIIIIGAGSTFLISVRGDIKKMLRLNKKQPQDLPTAQPKLLKL